MKRPDAPMTPPSVPPRPYESLEELEAMLHRMKEVGTDGLDKDWLKRLEGDFTPRWLDRLIETARLALAARSRETPVTAELRGAVENAIEWTRDRAIIEEHNGFTGYASVLREAADFIEAAL